MSKKPKVLTDTIHYFMYGRTACGYGEGKRPSGWTVGHSFAIHWKDVNCKGCLKHKSKPKTKGMTIAQYHVLRHSLGLNRETVPYRNKYVDEPNSKIPNQLVAKAMMVKGEPIDTFGGMCIYQVTNFGKKIAMKPFKGGV